MGDPAKALQARDDTSSKSAIRLFTVLCIAAWLPIWWVDYFFSTDVPAHLHSAFVFNGLISGGEGAGIYVLNEALVPNSLGHWIMSLLLLAISPAAASKVTAMITWAAFAASVPWLRFCAGSTNGLKPAVLIGAVLSYNYLWLLGLYNFILGAAICIFAIGLLFRWDGKLDSWQYLAISLLSLAIFLGHLIAFGVFALAAGLHVILRIKEYGKRGVAGMVAALLPAVAFASAYQIFKVNDSTFAPRWVIRELGLTLTGIANYLKQTDPLSMIGDYNVMPFVHGESTVYLIFSPTLWFALAILLLFVVTVLRNEVYACRIQLILMLCVLGVALAAPEDFGSTQGSILRARMSLLAGALFVPLYSVPVGRLARSFLYIALAISFALQTAALWEYSTKYDRDTHDFLSACDAIPKGDRIGSVLVLRDDSKFHESGLKRLSSVVGILKSSAVWDNYETGYYFFPVVAKTEIDRQFIRDFSTLNTFRTRQTGAGIDPEQLTALTFLLDSESSRMDTLIVWGQDEQVDHMVAKHFGPEPYFTNGEIRLYKQSISRP